MRLNIPALLILSVAGHAAAAELPPRFQVPSTVSTQAAKDLSITYRTTAAAPAASKPTSTEDWAHRRALLEKHLIPLSKASTDKLGVTLTDEEIGGVPVVRLRPAGYKPNGRLLIFLHGGAYTVFSAHSRLVPPALVAAATGDEVISVDYTVAPKGNWKIVTDQVIAVWRAVLATGIAPAHVGIFGDSAGGGLASGSVLKMRDLGLPLPGALYLMSPWADITTTGDSLQTLADFDPTLAPERLTWSADVYAAPENQKNPYVSPIYGDYSKAFPPTLIQGGTREILLSDFVRLYQAIRGGGHEAVLDLYEGMPHVFQSLTPDSPESRTAIARAASFLNKHLQSN